MKKRMYAVLTTVLFTTIGLIGVAEKVGAVPDESQRLRGLADRVFLVTVELIEDDSGIFELFFGLPVGTTFPNCYVFAAETDAQGNNWYETAFPTAGAWTQGSVGAKTDYAVDAGSLEQIGLVTPAKGRGVLQLKAESVSTVVIPGIIEGELRFLSVGEEIDASTASDSCPDGPIFTPPDSP